MKANWKNKAVLWIVVCMVCFGPTATFAETNAGGANASGNGTAANSTSTNAAENTAVKSNLDQVFDLLQTYHVSGVEGPKLEQAAIEAMIKTLDDPYTQYMPKEEWNKFQNAVDNNYFGIGARIAQNEKGAVLLDVFSGSPAEQAGLQRGDYLVTVAGNSVNDQPLDTIVNQIMGPENTKVSITVNRSGELLDKQVLRQRIQMPIVTSKMFDGGVGYIRLSSFSTNAGEMFVKEMDKLKAAGLRSLIFDLRDNSGGILQSAAEIAGQFFKDKVLIRLKDRNGVNQSYRLEGGTDAEYPIVLLVNEQSASASEVLTGALRDNNNFVTVIGTKTFGKGSVQSVIPLNNGAVLKLTTQEYMTPKMRPVNKVGLEPDFKVEGEIPQFVRGLYRAGMRNVKLTFDPFSYNINGYEIPDLVKIVRDGEKVYVPIRIAAAMMNWDVSWNVETNTVELSRIDKKKSLSSDSEGILMKDGTTYIDLSVFQQMFPGLQWSADGDQVTMIGMKQ